PGSRSDPLSLNLYTYCVNNPLRYHDPNGHAYVPMELPSGKTVYILDTDVGAYVMNGKSGSGAVIQPGQTANTVNFKGDVINLGTVVTANIGDNTYYNYGGTTTVNNYGTIGDIYVNGGNATVNNSGSIGTTNSVNNSELKVYNNGTIALIDSGNSDLLVINSGHIGLISTATGCIDPMNAITYDGSILGQPSILAVSQNYNNAQALMNGTLGTLTGGAKSTVDITPKSVLNFTSNSPFVEIDNITSTTLLQKLGAQSKLTQILFDQYPNAAIGIRVPMVDEIVLQRLMVPFLDIENNKLNIAKAALEFGIPKEVIASIILKEGFTMSINDSTSVWINTYFPGRNVEQATVGLGAISIQGARNVWNWYAEPSPIGFSGAIPSFLDDNKVLLDHLMYNNHNFNIRTISVNLLYCGYSDAKINQYDVGSWTSDNWREVLKGYNSNKGYDYADKVMEYFEPMKILAQ
ncbi:MAG: hypothetical protein FWH52_05935, partial [Synergistaceae bacterium]|nr:hypothetical protein [Synergistaceae bacterium]